MCFFLFKAANKNIKTTDIMNIMIILFLKLLDLNVSY